MKRKQNKGRYDSGRMLLFSIILVFAILGGVVFSVSQKISRESQREPGFDEGDD